MKKSGYRFHLWLGLFVWLGLSLSVSAAQAQSGFLSDWTWGYWGNSREDSRMTREQIIAREGYCPTGGCVLRLDRVEIKPDNARRGATLLLKTTYTILTPEQVAMPVAITREIFFQGKSLGKTKSIETRRNNGTWTQEINFTLPATAAAGIYRLVTRISTGYGTAQDSTDFQVN
jgi:hypothetical protein